MIKNFNIAIILCFFSSVACALEDDLLKSIEISAHGSKFQAERMKIAAENLANSTSTSGKAGGDPYRRKIIIPKNAYNKELRTNILIAAKIDFDKAPFTMKYEPDHPAADLEGMVKYPPIKQAIERADATESQISYDANLAVMKIANEMIDKTLEAMK